LSRSALPDTIRNESAHRSEIRRGIRQVRVRSLPRHGRRGDSMQTVREAQHTQSGIVFYAVSDYAEESRHSCKVG